MKAASTNAIVFNLAGAAILLTVIGYIGQSMLFAEAVAPCSQRYPAGRQFALEDANGKPMTSQAMQSQLGWRQWGVLQNVHVVQAQPSATEGPTSVLSIKLDKTADQRTGRDRSGVGFVWPMKDMEKAQSACLSYGIFMPSDFEFYATGHLPGLLGRDTFDDDGEEHSPKEPSGFAARVGWSGSGDVVTEVFNASANRLLLGSDHLKIWPRGRWVKVDQEVVLNAGGVDDGRVLLWLDGKLIVQRTDIQYRANEKGGFAGVVGDVGYPRADGKPAIFGLTPMVVQWQ